VIGRGADEGKPQRDVDAAGEVDGLERNERLIVIHAEDGVVAPPRLGMKEGVGGRGTLGIEALGAKRGDGRSDDLDLLAPERTLLAGMRIERRHGEPRLGNAEIALEARCGDAPRGDDASRSDK